MTDPPAVSRGARQCWRLLDWYRRRYGKVHPRQAKLADALGCTVRQVKRYIRELKQEGIVAIYRGARAEAAHYAVENYVEILWNSPKNVPTDVPTDVPTEAEKCPHTPYSSYVAKQSNSPSGWTEEFHRQVLEAGKLTNIPGELVAKLHDRARRRGVEACRAAAVFLEVYWRAHQHRVTGDGTGYLLAAFENSLAAASGTDFGEPKSPVGDQNSGGGSPKSVPPAAEETPETRRKPPAREPGHSLSIDGEITKLAARKAVSGGKS